ncbi:hypothetical protein Pmani_023672 [Petrolisthes manimaculis]|uniref:Uncharacterized protein n=1 Tax=Petrolisthes manimaculis TaxID=1843537 RepID=A0AAE1PBX7_9EUCA|nr:hypothetical protein Pmani_023672 [Petrolisthes manimaculis]
MPVLASTTGMRPCPSPLSSQRPHTRLPAHPNAWPQLGATTTPSQPSSLHVSCSDGDWGSVGMSSTLTRRASHLNAASSL